MTVTDYLRDRLYLQAGLYPVGDKTQTLESLRQTEWCALFERLMRNRLLVGFFRYGGINSNNRYNNVKQILLRTLLYMKDGNLEHLVDVANFAMVEFVQSNHPKKHFESQDDGIHAEPI